MDLIEKLNIHPQTYFSQSTIQTGKYGAHPLSAKLTGFLVRACSECSHQLLSAIGNMGRNAKLYSKYTGKPPKQKTKGKQLTQHDFNSRCLDTAGDDEQWRVDCQTTREM